MLAGLRDPKEERKVVDEMLKIFYDDPAWIMLYFQPDFYGVSNRTDWTPRRDEKIDALRRPSPRPEAVVVWLTTFPRAASRGPCSSGRAGVLLVLPAPRSARQPPTGQKGRSTH